MAFFLRTHYKVLVLTILSALLYWYFAYELIRSDFIVLITSLFVLFVFTYLIIQKAKISFWYLAILGILFRLIFMGVLPNLSQDFYRFLWDGRVLFQGMNPYLITPQSYIVGSSMISNTVIIAQAQDLVNGMGPLNASHYSNYPPVNQLLFVLTALFAGKSVLGSSIVLILINILADIGILYFGKKILEVLGKDPKWIFWYFLNPFIIIELSGNLHAEGVMLLFLIWSIYLLIKGQWVGSSIVLGISISVKLLPLLILPILFQWFIRKENSVKGWWKLGIYYILALGTFAISFAPFISKEVISHYLGTIGLWFQDFEFNASVYYVIRWIGFKIVGWNIIETVGLILPIIIFLFIIALSIFRNNKEILNMMTAMLFAVSFYFLLATTIHPWYIATPLLLSLFTKYRFPIVWSFMVMLSYAAYGENGFHENLWLVGIEYVVVILFFIWELSRKDQRELGFLRL